MHRVSNKYKYIVLILLLISTSFCAKHVGNGYGPDSYGFFFGLWHGFVFPFSLIGVFVSWILSFLDIYFLDNVTLVGRPNTGFLLYYVGYFFGLSAWLGASKNS